jgi:hypothetical protein
VSAEKDAARRARQQLADEAEAERIRSGATANDAAHLRERQAAADRVLVDRMTAQAHLAAVPPSAGEVRVAMIGKIALFCLRVAAVVIFAVLLMHHGSHAAVGFTGLALAVVGPRGLLDRTDVLKRWRQSQ